MLPADSPKSSKRRISLSLDLRLIIVLLLAVIVSMLLLWKPWQYNPKATDRTISVTGEATLKAVPDEFVFSPSYEFKNANRKAALAALSKKSTEIIAKLKKLGVADNQIKTNANDYETGIYYPADKANQLVYTLSLTITVNNRDLGQKIQDYLVTTAASGQISPQPSFSEAQRKSLENQARDQATKEARSKAEQSAKNLGFSIGKVKSLTDGSGFGGPIILDSLNAGSVKSSAESNLSVQPGENELRYFVTVVYYIR